MILEPLSAAVAKTEKSLLKAIELILVPSWTNDLATTLPFSSYLITYPLFVETKNDLLSAYHKARVEIKLIVLSFSTMVVGKFSYAVKLLLMMLVLSYLSHYDFVKKVLKS